MPGVLPVAHVAYKTVFFGHIAPVKFRTQIVSPKLQLIHGKKVKVKVK